MRRSELTHIWSEVQPISDIQSLLPSGVSLVYRADQADSAVASAKSAQAVLASSLLQYNADLFDQLPNLQILCRTGIGIDNLDLKAATERGIVCCHTPDGPTQSTAEHATALLLGIMRRLKQGNDNLAADKWGPRAGMLMGDEVTGKTLGLVGLGRIGQRMAQMCGTGLGMRVIGHDPYVKAEDVAHLGIEFVALERVVADADVVSLHAPSTPETYHLMDAERIAQMKDGSYLVNVARGPLVDPQALLDAIDSGKLAGAGIDVFEPEPPEVGSRIRKHPNIIATPHIAGVTKESRARMEQMAIERILTFFQGKRPENVVNPALFDS